MFPKICWKHGDSRRSSKAQEVPLKYGSIDPLVRALALNFPKLKPRGLSPTTDAIPLPKTEPRTMREHLVVPSVRSREVVGAQRPNIRCLEHFL